MPFAIGGLIIAPGLERRVQDYWPDLERRITDGKSHGIINVVAYGYHSFQSLSYEEVKPYTPGMFAGDFLKAYQEKQQQVELERIRELIPYLKIAKKNFWMITLVTKQDLWWNDRANVEAFYRDGEYGQLLSEVTKARGEQNFRHEILSTSLVISNFLSGTNQLLASTVGGYDENLKIAHEQQLVKTVQTLAEVR